MTFDIKNIDKQIEVFAYEKPILKKYGTMKELTYSTGGSLVVPQGKQGGDHNNPNMGGGKKYTSGEVVPNEWYT